MDRPYFSPVTGVQLGGSEAGKLSSELISTLSPCCSIWPRARAVFSRTGFAAGFRADDERRAAVFLAAAFRAGRRTFFARDFLAREAFAAAFAFFADVRFGARFDVRFLDLRLGALALAFFRFAMPLSLMPVISGADRMMLR